MTNETSRVLTLVFTDLADSTALKTERGDQAVGEMIAQHRGHVTSLADETAGRIIDWAGDGCFLAFDTPSAGVDFGLKLQQIHAAEPDLPRVRVGVHMGEVTVRSQPDGTERVEGLAVDLASRIESLAIPGQLLMSSTVFDSARQRLRADDTGAAIAWRAHGEYEFKGFDDPLDICEAGFEATSPLEAPTGSEKAHRAVSPSDEETLGWRPAVGLNIPRREQWILEEPLGEGGFGEVWLASHDKTRVKRVFKFTFESDRVKGLKREVVLFRLLRESLGDRDDIAQILEWDFENAPYFIESEYTEGGDLKDWAARQGGMDRVPLATRFELVAQTAVALGAAHSVGVLHKDIKPGNILISEAKEKGVPRATLTDFGIGLLTDAKALLERGITAAGMTDTLSGSSSSGTGTRLYMAPELIEGKIATTRSDIYALGVVLYQVAIGDLTHAVAPGWERDIEDDLLREDIAACVDGNPDHRLTSAEELAERIRSLDTRREAIETARREREEAESAKRIAEQAQKRRRQFTLITAAGITLTAIIAIIALREYQRAENQSALSAQLEAANTEMSRVNLRLEDSLTATEDARRRAEYGQYVSTIQLAGMHLNNGQFVTARSELLSTLPEYRDWEWGHLVDRAWTDQGDANAVPRSREATAALTWTDSAPRIVHELPSEAGMVIRGTFTPGGERLVTANFNSTARLWNAATGELLTTIGERGQFPMYNAVLLPKHRRLVTSTNAAVLWNSVTGEFITRLSAANTNITSDISRNHNESLVAISYDDHTVETFDPITGEQVARFIGATSLVNCLVFSPDQEYLLATDSTGNVLRWRLESTELTETVTPPEPGLTQLSPDGSLAGTSTGSGAVIWNVETKSILSRFSGTPVHGTWGLARFSPDLSAILIPTAAESGVHIYDVDSGDLIAQLPSAPNITAGGEFSSDGTAVVVGGQDGVGRLWRPFHPTDETRRDTFGAGHGLLYQLAFSPDGRHLAAASYDGTAVIFELGTGEVNHVLGGHTDRTSAVSYNADGTRLATRGHDGEMRVWDTATGTPIAGINPTPEPYLAAIAALGGALGGPVLSTSGIREIDASRQGDRFISGAGRNIIAVFDFDSGEQLINLEAEGGYASGDFSPNGELVAISIQNEATVYLLDSRTGELIAKLEGHTQNALDIHFSPDGTRLLTASIDGTARVWDLATHQELFALTAHTGFLFAGRYSPDGRRILTSSADNTCKIWDAETGEELTTLAGHGSFVRDAEFSPDGRRIMSYSADSTVKVWDLEGNELSTETVSADAIHAKWSPDGSQIVSVWGDGQIRVRSSISWQELSQMGDDETPFEERLQLLRESYAP